MAAFYILLTAFCVVQMFKRGKIPEVMYLFLLLLLCASPFIHSEFRYSLPVWNTLVLVPGLLIATLTRGGWRSSLDAVADDPSVEIADSLKPIHSLAA